MNGGSRNLDGTQRGLGRFGPLLRLGAQRPITLHWRRSECPQSGGGSDQLACRIECEWDRERAVNGWGRGCRLAGAWGLWRGRTGGG